MGGEIVGRRRALIPGACNGRRTGWEATRQMLHARLIRDDGARVCVSSLRLGLMVKPASGGSFFECGESGSFSRERGVGFVFSRAIQCHRNRHSDPDLGLLGWPARRNVMYMGCLSPMLKARSNVIYMGCLSPMRKALLASSSSLSSSPSSPSSSSSLSSS